MMPGAGGSERFDQITWSENGVACFGTSLVSDLALPPIRLEEVVEQVSEMLKHVRAPDPSLQRGMEDFVEYVNAGPRMRRDWWLACGTEMANAWYESLNDDAGTADIADCEEMLRTIRFTRARGA